MTPADLAPTNQLLASLNLFAFLQLILISCLVLVELIRLCIVIYRSVKGRINNV